jgi:hypothetical protein
MPIRYAAERDKVGVIRQLTTLTVEEFEMLVPSVQTAFLDHMSKWTLEGKPRTGRRYSQYANCPLPTPQDRLLFVLMYLKAAPLQQLHATAFGLTQPKANLWLHALLTALRSALQSSGDLGARSLEALRERLAAFTSATSAEPLTDEGDLPPPTPFFQDGTERAIPRPTDATEQKDFYSGKKKRHMIKKVLLASDTRQALFLSDTYEGSVHDKAIADTTPYPLPAGSELLDDLGFVGYTLAGVIHTRPFKKPKGGELTAEQKATNQQIAKRRMLIEHVMSGIKRCRIVKDTIDYRTEHSF